MGQKNVCAEEREDAIPDEYRPETRRDMVVTGRKGAYIAVLIGGGAFRCV